MPDWSYEKRPNVITSRPPRTVIFRDLNQDFSQTNGGDIIVEDDLALQKQIRHLLSTPTGSEDFEPTFGSRVPYRLHEPVCDLTAYLLETDVILAFIRWLSDKVILVNPRIIPHPDNDFYIAKLPYRKISERTLTTFTFEFGV